eukprot:1138763-Pelagomonas_calceolata.AAC.1
MECKPCPETQTNDVADQLPANLTLFSIPYPAPIPICTKRLIVKAMAEKVPMMVMTDLICAWRGERFCFS